MMMESEMWRRFYVYFVVHFSFTVNLKVLYATDLKTHNTQHKENNKY